MDASTRSPPLFTRIVVNDIDAFFGFSRIQRRTIPIDQDEQDVCDLTGKDAVMFRYESVDTKGSGALFVARARRWFDSVWSQISGTASDLELI